jgi:DNA repair photolyase
MILRDLDLLTELAREGLCQVMVSVTTLNETLRRQLEPRASTGVGRIKVIERLAKAGVPVGVLAAPMIPRLNEPELEQIIKAAVDAGAGCADYILLRLPHELTTDVNNILRRRETRQISCCRLKNRTMRFPIPFRFFLIGLI